MSTLPVATEPLDATATQVASFGSAVRALRRVQDALAAASPDPRVLAETTAALDAVREQLGPLVGTEEHQAYGRLPELPSRGHALVPEYRLLRRTEGRVEGVVEFSRWFMGAGMAAHGGAVSLMFDDVLGMLAVHEAPTLTRTAYLKVDFRRVAPVDVELGVRAWVEQVDGRKWFVRGELWSDDGTCAVADGLFVTLLPGQK